jgi:dolichyldiphosphatase
MARLKSLSITHVQYEQGDIIGELLAYSSLAPVFTIVAFTALIVMNRNIKTVYFLTGQLLNELFNLCLKLWIKEPRPAQLLTDYGMPSSHTQFMWFFTTYSFWYLLNRPAPLKLKRWISVVPFAILCLTMGVTISRLYLGYHTFKQVAVGFLVGILSGTTWYLFLSIAEPYFKPIINSDLGKLLELQDTINKRD